MTNAVNAIPADLLKKVTLPCYCPSPFDDNTEHPPVDSVTEEMVRNGEIVVCTGLHDLPEDRRSISHLVAAHLGWYALDDEVGSRNWIHDYVIDLGEDLESAQVLYLPLKKAELEVSGTLVTVILAESTTAMWKGHQVCLTDTSVSWFEGYKRGAFLVFTGDAAADVAVEMLGDFGDGYGERDEELYFEAIDMMDRLMDSMKGASPAKTLMSCLSTTEYGRLPNTKGSIVLVFNGAESDMAAIDASVLGRAADLYAQGPDKAQDALQLLAPMFQELASTLRSARG